MAGNNIGMIKEWGMAITFGAILLLNVAIPTVKTGVIAANLTESETAVAGLVTIGVLFSLADAGFSAMGSKSK
jgi:hypothetical protein